jgi:hypothetical protein
MPFTIAALLALDGFDITLLIGIPICVVLVVLALIEYAKTL